MNRIGLQISIFGNSNFSIRLAYIFKNFEFKGTRLRQRHYALEVENIFTLFGAKFLQDTMYQILQESAEV